MPTHEESRLLDDDDDDDDSASRSLAPALEDATDRGRSDSCPRCAALLRCCALLLLLVSLSAAAAAAFLPPLGLLSSEASSLSAASLPSAALPAAARAASVEHRAAVKAAAGAAPVEHTAPAGEIYHQVPWDSSVHFIPQGGSLAIECTTGTSVTKVEFASFGLPELQGGKPMKGACHSRESVSVVSKACLGQSHCCLPVNDMNFKLDPCHGKVKTLAVVLRGCVPHQSETRYKRHCSLIGQARALLMLHARCTHARHRSRTRQPFVERSNAAGPSTPRLSHERSAFTARRLRKHELIRIARTLEMMSSNPLEMTSNSPLPPGRPP